MLVCIAKAQNGQCSYIWHCSHSTDEPHIRHMKPSCNRWTWAHLWELHTTPPCFSFINLSASMQIRQSFYILRFFVAFSWQIPNKTAWSRAQPKVLGQQWRSILHYVHFTCWQFIKARPRWPWEAGDSPYATSYRERSARSWPDYFRASRYIDQLHLGEAVGKCSGSFNWGVKGYSRI